LRLNLVVVVGAGRFNGSDNVEGMDGFGEVRDFLLCAPAVGLVVRVDFQPMFAHPLPAFRKAAARSISQAMGWRRRKTVK
jgi:hypothetical protein